MRLAFVTLAHLAKNKSYMDKLIFLDIDGVISTQKFHYALDKDACDLLGKIIDATDAMIVMSSSWRKNTVEDTKNYLTTIGHSVPFLFPYADRIIGVTIRAYAYIMQGVHLGIPRGVEIKQWIDTHIHSDNGENWDRKEVGIDFNYVILDDDSDMLLEQEEHFIKTDTYLGLSVDDVEKAISILNG